MTRPRDKSRNKGRHGGGKGRGAGGASGGPSRSRRTPWWILVAVIAATGLAYLPSLGNGFTNWDDPVYVTGNPMVLGPLAGHLGPLFTSVVSLNYHPLTMLSLALDRAVQGPSPRGFHLTNLLFHLLNTALVFRLAYLLGGRRTAIAAVAGLVFGLHPMHVESVAWISGRKDVLYVFFFLAGLLAWLRHRKSGGLAWYAAALALFLASVLCKAMAVVFPVVLLLLDYLQRRPWSRKLVLEKVPFLAVSAGFGAAAVAIQSREAIGTVYPLGQRLVFACYGLVMYAVKLLAPVRLSAFYPYPPRDVPLPAVFWLAPVVVLGAAAGVWLLRRRSRVPAFALGFYLVTVILVLQILSVGQAILADRYTYLSYFGLAFLLGWMLDTAARARLRPAAAGRVLAGVAVIGGLAMGAATRERIRVWSGSERLWTDVIGKYPDAAEAYANRGSFYGESGRVQDALVDLQKAVSLDGSRARYLELLGTAYGASGDFDRALATFAEGLRQDPRSPGLWLNRAITYSLLGRLDDALPAYQKALELGVQEPLKVYVNRGRAYVTAGRLDRATEDAAAALSLDPGNGQAEVILALVARARGDTATAVEHARRAQAAGLGQGADLVRELSGGAGAPD